MGFFAFHEVNIFCLVIFIYFIVFLPFVCFLDDDLEGYDKMVSGRRKTGRVSFNCFESNSLCRNDLLMF